MLHTARERHITCNPALAQFVVVEGFTPVVCEGPFDKRSLDEAFVRDRESLVSRGYLRLREMASLALPIIDYPLPEVREAMAHRGGG